MSTIRLTRRGRIWYLVLSYQDEQGAWRQKWESTGTSDRERAEEILAEKRAQIRAGIRLEDDPTVAQWLRAWLADVTASNALKPLAPNTAADYARIVEKNLTPAIGKLKLRDLKPADVQAMMTGWLGEGLGRSTVRYRHAVLRAALREAERQGLILRNAAALARRPQPADKPAQHLRSEETRRLVAANDADAWLPFLELGLMTGLRLGELLGLHWPDVDWDAATITVMRQRQRLKGGHGVVERAVKSRHGFRVIALPGRAVDLLKEIRATQGRESLAAGVPAPDHIFAHRDAGQWQPWSPEAAGENMRRLYDAAGLPRPEKPTHTLRHTHFSALSRAGMAVKDAQLRAGHSDPKVTLDVYTHSDVEGQRPGAEAAANLLLPPKSKGGEKDAL